MNVRQRPMVRAPGWWEEDTSLQTPRHDALFGPVFHCGDNGPQPFRCQNRLSQCTLLALSITVDTVYPARELRFRFLRVPVMIFTDSFMK
jgi:hypothetical protein